MSITLTPAQLAGSVYCRDAAAAPVPGSTTDPLGVLLDALGGWFSELPGWGAPLAGGLASVAAAGWWLRHRGARSWWRRCAVGARFVEIAAPPQPQPAAALMLWSHLHALLHTAPTPATAPRASAAWRRWSRPGGARRAHVVWEVVFGPAAMGIRMWVPAVIDVEAVARVIENAWPGARTRVSEPLPAPQRGSRDRRHTRRAVVGARLRLTRPACLPLGTEFPTGVDPLAGLWAAGAGLPAGTHALVQVSLRPTTGHGGARQARRLANTVLDALASAARPTPRPRTTTTDHLTGLRRNARDRAQLAKTDSGSGLYHSTIHIAATTTGTRTSLGTPRSPGTTVHGTEGRGGGVEAGAVLAARVRTLVAAFGVFSGHNALRRRRLRQPWAAVTERRPPGSGDVLSVVELAAIAHLPQDPAQVGMPRAGAKAIEPVPVIPVPGQPGAIPLGISVRGRPVALDEAALMHHLQLLGPTGSGKTELLVRLMLHTAATGWADVGIDIKGDGTDDLLARLPEHLAEKVVLFDSADPHPPPVLNPLQDPDPILAVENIVGIFARVYAASWGHRSEDLLRCGLLTLTTAPRPDGQPPPTLLDLHTLLTDPAYRAQATSGISDPILRAFWASYDDLPDTARAYTIAPLMNKLRGLLMRPFIRAALCGTSTISMDHVLAHQQLCLVRIPQASLGLDTARLFGSLIVAATWQAATRRAYLPAHLRPPAGLFIDECFHFLNLPYPVGDMLAEARSYQLGITLAHQNLTQLQPLALAEAVSANARNKVLFTASVEDARRLARHTYPHLDEHDLAHQDAFHAAVRQVHHHIEQPTYTARTQKLPPPIPGRAAHARALAHRHTPPPPATAPGTHRPPRNRTGGPDPARTRAGRTGPDHATARTDPRRPDPPPRRTGHGPTPTV